MEFTILPDTDPGFEPPSYRTPGSVEFEAHDLGGGAFEYEVEDYDGCAFWISEGEGFDYWLDGHVELPGPGRYRITGIVGHYFRGDGYATDDDVDWDWEYLERTV